MGQAGNSNESAERRRFELAMRARSADRILQRARELPNLTLDDMLRITSELVALGDHRAERARVRLLGQILTTRVEDLETADLIFTLVSELAEDHARSQLARYCR